MLGPLRGWFDTLKGSSQIKAYVGAALIATITSAGIQLATGGKYDVASGVNWIAAYNGTAWMQYNGTALEITPATSFSGAVTTTGEVQAADGTAADPSVHGTTDVTTGLAFSDTSVIASVDGAAALTCEAANATAAGDVTVGDDVVLSSAAARINFTGGTSAGVQWAGTDWLNYNGSVWTVNPVGTTSMKYNGTEWFGFNGTNTIASGGNVGIGETVPTVKLTITGTPATSGDARHLVYVKDSTSYAAGVGGGITFVGKHNSAAAYADFAGIKGIKENATDGNYAGALVFATRANGASPAEKMRLGSDGTLTLIGDLAATGGFRSTVGPFVISNTAASQTDTDVPLAGNVSGGDWRSVRAGSVVGISAYCNAAVAGSNLVFEVTGAAIANALTIAPAAQGGQATPTAAAFAAGTLVGVTYTTDGSYTSTAIDCDAWLEIEE